ncbi:MAG: TrmB family transcriptional regulator [Rhodanobacteraceae bacterium]
MLPDNLELLQKLGFTVYEAKAWLALASAGPLTGYEVAKRSGIPRANIYPVLKRLVERGAARCFDTPDGPRHVATPTAELLESMQREQQDLFAAAKASLPRQPRQMEERLAYALQTVAQVRATARALVAGARDSLLIAVEPLEAALLAADLQAADARGVKITTLCLQACEPECGGCRGTVHRCACASGQTSRWLIVAADDARAVVAEFDGLDGVHAIETRQPLVVQLATAYIRQSAALAVLGAELGERFTGLVSLQARRSLDDLRPTEGFPRRSGPVATDETGTFRPVTGNTKEDSR